MPKQPIGLSGIFPVAPIFCFIAMLGILIPAPVYFKSTNSGTLLYMFWAFLPNLFIFINTIAWRGNLANRYPVYCDIVAGVLSVAHIGLACATLCITRRLWKVSRVNAVMITPGEKRKDLLIDLAIGFGIPILAKVCHYVVQGHRYDIWEDFGCIETVYTAYISVPLYFAWGLIITLISCVYGGIALRQFIKRRRDLEELLSSTNTGISANRYLRLMWLSSIDLFVGLPVNVYNLLIPFGNWRPWISWEDTHSNFSRVAFIRRVLFDLSPKLKLNVYLRIAAFVYYGLIFFVLFGFGREVIRTYTDLYYKLLKPFGVVRPQKSSLPKMKRTLLDKILRRPGKSGQPITSVSASMPTFDIGRSIGSTTKQKSPTATFDWDLDLEDGKKLNEKEMKTAGILRPTHDPLTPTTEDDDEKQSYSSERRPSGSSQSTKITKEAV